VTRHQRAEYLDATLKQIGIVSDMSDVHHSLSKVELTRSEKDVTSLQTSLNNFLNPFETKSENKDCLICLSSGQHAPKDIADDLLHYVDKGEKATVEFMKTRLIDRTVSLHAPMKKLRLHTFEKMSVKKMLTSSQKKQVKVKAERNLLGRLLVLSQSNAINLDKLFKYPLAPIPWALATADGTFVKTDKAQLMHLLELESTEKITELPTDGTYVIDGNAMLRALVKLPATFGDLAKYVFRCLPKAKCIHFVTDTYKQNSIKDVERSCRGSSEPVTIGGSSITLPRDFASFMQNSSNKRDLIKFILEQWQLEEYAELLQGRSLFFVFEQQCYRLESNGRTVFKSLVEELCSSQEEADTRIILHSLYASCSSSSSSSSSFNVVFPRNSTG
jgi:hypothetical protein